MKDLFFEFLKSPDLNSYLPVRSALVASEHYDPYSEELFTVYELLENDRLDDARNLLAQSMPNLLLSPSAHFVLSHIARESNDNEHAEFEQFVAVKCCEAILATGDGTKANPYVVTRVSDEYDVLGYLGKQLGGQALIEHGGRHLDQITCKDGSEIWFDIGYLHAKANSMLGG